MEEFSRSFTDTFQAVLAIAVVAVLAIWWWVFYLLFARKKENVGRAAFMMITFLCVICEMARIIDPFARWDIWSNETLRTYLTIELLLMLTLLLIAADAASWLNYFAVESLLLKGQRRYRHSLYAGVVLINVESIILVGVNTFMSEYARGLTIGWLLCALIMILIALLTMYQSVREVGIAVKLEQNTHLEEVRNEFFFETEYNEVENEKKAKNRKKSVRLMKYLCCFACLFILDLCFGGKPSAGEMDLMHLLYDVVLKVVLMVMLIQRRPVKVARTYEVDIHHRYKPFDQTIFSGCDATRTVFKLQEMVRKKTTEVEKEKLLQSELENHYDQPSQPTFLTEQHERTPSHTLPLEGVEMIQTPQHTEPGSETDMRVRPPIEVMSSNECTPNNAEIVRPSFGESESLSTKDQKATDDKSAVLLNEPRKTEPPVKQVRKSRVYNL